MGFFKEFKEFATRGNVMELAIGIIIGGAFGKIVTSLVNDIIMPPIGLLTGGVDFKELFLDLSGKQYETLTAAREAGAPIIAYGNFISTTIDFLIIALSIFLVIRYLNKLKPMEGTLEKLKGLKNKDLSMIKEKIKTIKEKRENKENL